MLLMTLSTGQIGDWGQYNALNIDAEIMGDDFWVGGSDKMITNSGICCLTLRRMLATH